MGSETIRSWRSPGTIMTVTELFTYLAAALVAILASARLTRLLVVDSWPPAAWLRMKWDDLTAQENGDDGPWGALVHCPWCMAPWMSLIVFGTGLLSHFSIVWWVFFGWLALSYVSASIVARDSQ